MAVTVINPTLIKEANILAVMSATDNGIVATSATDGFEVAIPYRDDKIVFVVENTSSTAEATLTLKAGESPFAAEDVVLTIGASAKAAFVIDSGKFKKGGKLIAIPSALTVKLTCIVQPF